MLTLMSFLFFTNDAKFEPYLLRMNLMRPKNVKELVYKKFLKFILRNRLRSI